MLAPGKLLPQFANGGGAEHRMGGLEVLINHKDVITFVLQT